MAKRRKRFVLHFRVHHFPDWHFPPPAFRWSVIIQFCIFSRPKATPAVRITVLKVRSKR